MIPDTLHSRLSGGCARLTIRNAIIAAGFALLTSFTQNASATLCKYFLSDGTVIYNDGPVGGAIKGSCFEAPPTPPPLKPGDIVKQGLVIEVKGEIAKVQTSQGERWFRLIDLVRMKQ